MKTVVQVASEAIDQIIRITGQVRTPEQRAWDLVEAIRIVMQVAPPGRGGRS